MGFTEYVGARYVPIFGRLGEETIQWDNSKPYEPLTIVLHEGNSFTSRQYVPVGIEIDNKEYWAETGNYNAQIEQYRNEVLGFDNRLDSVDDRINEVENTVENFPNVIKKISTPIKALSVDEELINAIVQVAHSYIDHNNNPLEYGHFGANWYGSDLTGTKKPIDCSGFIEMLMLGVPYEYSRYNPYVSDNKIGKAGYFFDIYEGNQIAQMSNELALTYQKAKWADENGYGFYPNKDFSNIKPGDILFYSFAEHPEQDRFLEIDHCEMFIGYSNRFGSKTFITLNASDGRNEYGVCACSYRDAGFNDKLVYCMRVPFGVASNNKHTTKLIQYMETNFTPAFNINIKPNHLISVVFEGKQATADGTFIVQRNGTNFMQSEPTNADNLDTWRKYVMLYKSNPAQDTTNFEQISIRATAGGRIRNASISDGFNTEIIKCDSVIIQSTQNITDFLKYFFDYGLRNFTIIAPANHAVLNKAGTWNCEMNVNESTKSGFYAISNVTDTTITTLHGTISAGTINIPF